MQAARVHERGGPERLVVEDAAVPPAGIGDVLVRVHAASFTPTELTWTATWTDRLGRDRLPIIPGHEVSGVVAELGYGTFGLAVGDEVYGLTDWYRDGTAAEYVAVEARNLAQKPASLDHTATAAIPMAALTATQALFDIGRLVAGQTVVIHGAGGGVGSFAVQLAHTAGARVIGTVSTEEKERLAREAGADEVILYTKADFETETKRLTAGRGVQVVYDSVGKTTFDKSLNCLAPRGLLVLFGQASGPVPPLDPQVLNAKGSLFLTRPTLGNYTATPEELNERAGDVLGWIATGHLRLRVEAALPLAQAAEAHQRLASRSTSGKLLLLP